MSGPDQLLRMTPRENGSELERLPRVKDRGRIEPFDAKPTVCGLIYGREERHLK